MAGLAAIVLVALTLRRSQLQGGSALQRRSVGQIARGYFTLLRQQRARRTYGYVLINAVIHSGIYTWLGVYFSQRFGLTLVGIGLACCCSTAFPVSLRSCHRPARRPIRAHPTHPPRSGRRVHCRPAPRTPCSADPGCPRCRHAVPGYDLTQPLLAGIVTQLSAQRGQAMGLNVCTLFIGFGAGSLVPSAAHHRVHRSTGHVQYRAALAAVIGLYFASERPHPMPSVKDPR
ncbi:MFS transporter [Mycolicibacterium aubagnense]|uniref:MFS transporter n=1 Tax=Mycolicibacterium aubagnense TaxID=319707 RepID=A0ABM7INJ9_9MYCO|nr:hypothetical protein [Mycolicibacterium aubagnense]BBX88351.1 hypothetical protein MAUB_65520 [Mycolicibacterium aubagnense]